MAITEVFPNPTVKRVIFQITFPNLFYLENKIGDYQLKIMERFPTSEIIYKQNIVLGLGMKTQEIPKEPENNSEKIWQFNSLNKIRLNVQSNSVDLSSETHKTYNNSKNESERFRDAIIFVVKNFLEITKIPIINRVGLRYIDECPLPDPLNNDEFLKFYNSAFPLQRFDLSATDEMTFVGVKKYDKYLIRYAETLKAGKLMMDFDGSRQNIKAEEYLAVADEIHTIISNEYESSLKAPVLELMRKGGT